MLERSKHKPDAEAPATPPGAQETEGGTAPAGAHLKRRQDRNSDLTESSQADPTGGAHSDVPDPTNP